MFEAIFTVLIGIVCIVIGVMNMRGNISMLHAHHRKRVSEEDRLPFGKMVGAGTLIIGVGLILGGVFFGLYALLENGVYEAIGGAILGVGFAVGLVISFIAMKKYNKGIF